MDAVKAAQLERAITDLQGRWGSGAICALREASATSLEGIPTGFPVLDGLTEAGGIPVGYITALMGRPSSGITTIAYWLAAKAQRQFRVVIWLDTNRVFDPASATEARVNFRDLLLSRPDDWTRALAVTRDVAEQLLHTLIILPLPLDATPEDSRLLKDLLRVLPPICHRNGNTVVLLHSGPGRSDRVAQVLGRSALVIQTERIGWLPGLAGGIAGISTRATLLKSRFGPPGGSADLQIAYPEFP